MEIIFAIFTVLFLLIVLIVIYYAFMKAQIPSESEKSTCEHDYHTSNYNYDTSTGEEVYYYKCSKCGDIKIL